MVEKQLQTETLGEEISPYEGTLPAPEATPETTRGSLGGRILRAALVGGALLVVACSGRSEAPSEAAPINPPTPPASASAPEQEKDPNRPKLSVKERVAARKAALHERMQGAKTRASERMAVVKQRMADRKAEISKMLAEKRSKIKERREARLSAKHGIVGKALRQIAQDYDLEDPERGLSVVIGDPAIRIFPYAEVAKSMPDLTAEEYFFFIRDTVASPEDAAKLSVTSPYTRDRLVDYKTRGESTIDSVNVIKRGYGDCDDLSELVRECLDFLGRKTGKDYNPRVISQKGVAENGRDGHAVAIYEDGGKRYAVDQGAPKRFKKIQNASRHFKRPSKRHSLGELQTDYSNGAALKWTLDNRTMEKNYQKLQITVPQEDLDMDTFRYETVMPEDWKQYEDVVIFFGREVKAGGEYTSMAFQDGKLEQILYRNGEIQYEKYKNGKIAYRKYRSGNKDADFFEEGRLVETSFSKGKYERLWYDDNEQPFQARTRSGRIIKI